MYVIHLMKLKIYITHIMNIQKSKVTRWPLSPHQCLKETLITYKKA